MLFMSEEERFVWNTAWNLHRDYGDHAHFYALQRLEYANDEYLHSRKEHWRKVLEALDNLPPNRGKQTKEQ